MPSGIEKRTPEEMRKKGDIEILPASDDLKKSASKSEMRLSANGTAILAETNRSVENVLRTLNLPKDIVREIDTRIGFGSVLKNISERIADIPRKAKQDIEFLIGRDEFFYTIKLLRAFASSELGGSTDTLHAMLDTIKKQCDGFETSLIRESFLPFELQKKGLQKLQDIALLYHGACPAFKEQFPELKNISERALDIFQTLLPHMERNMTTTMSQIALADYIRILKQSIVYNPLSNDGRFQKMGDIAFDMMIRHLPRTRSRLVNIHILDLLLSYGDTEERKETVRQVMDIFFRSPSSKKAKKISEILSHEDSRLPEGTISEMAEYAGVYIRNIFQTYDIPHSILKGWESNITANSAQKLRVMLENGRAIELLERKRSGSVRTLYERFGIANFGRYPLELLIKQYDERNRTDRPYGVILNARADWNGAFSEHQGIYDKLLRSLRGKFSLRVIEADKKRIVARRLLELDQRYGERHKISFAFVGGHGTKDSIQFGDIFASTRANSEQVPVNKGALSLTLKDLTGSRYSRAGMFFEDHPSIILISCSTGIAGGIAQKLSKVIGADVFAPDTPTNIGKVRVRIQHGRPVFNIEYAEKFAARAYAAGKQDPRLVYG